MDNKKYILVTGSAFVNKGSEAMMYVAADELTKRFPEKQVVMLSPFDFRKNTSIYAFKIVPDYLSRYFPMPYRLLRKIGTCLLGINRDQKTRQEEAAYKAEFEDILSNTAFIVNIGGYALSSQKEENIKKPFGSISFLLRILYCKEKNIPIYLMPQSFGPFQYEYPFRPFVLYLLKSCLKYPRLIFAREQDGYQYMKPYCRENQLLRFNDTVITDSNIVLHNIYREEPNWNYITIKEEDVVAVIPNMRCVDSSSKEKAVQLYCAITQKLLDNQHMVYLIRHSKEDIEGCLLIKEHFSTEARVKIIEDELNCFEYLYLIRQFQYVVASRFHAIVHAYKENVPCIVLGWAVKYQELLQLFHQEKYLFQIQDELDITKIAASIDYMEIHLEEEKNKIESCMRDAQKVNAYDYLETDYKEHVSR